MSVSNGQPANASTFNTAFASKSADNELTGIQSLNNGSSGAPITNVQQEINDVKSDISTLSSSVSNMETAVTDHETRIDDLESDASSYATKTGIETLTNKDIDGGTASNSNRITLPKNTLANLTALTRKEGTIAYATDQQKAYVDNGSSLVAVGSGSGSGGINYISNPDAETDATGWATYNDGSDLFANSYSFLDGTAGSLIGITWARSTSSPIRGSASFLLTKPASDQIGRGASYQFSHPGMVEACDVTFEYNVVSGTYATGDLRVVIYDVTTGYILEPSNAQIQKVGATTKYKGTFQTTSGSTSYRLCIHVSSTSASAYTVKFDSISVGPQNTIQGAFVSDGISYTPTLGAGFGTATNVSFRYWRVGENILVKGSFNAGTVAASASTISLPFGLSFASSVAVANQRLGGANQDSGTNSNLIVQYSTSTAVRLMNNSGQVLGNQITTTGTGVYVEFMAPITGWSSGVTFSSDAGDGRVIGFRAKNATATLTSSFSKVTFSTVDRDDVSGYASGTYTVKAPGWYHVNAAIAYTRSATVAGNSVQIAIYKNGSADVSKIARDFTTDGQSRTIDISDRMYCTAGTTIEIYAATEGTSPAILSSTSLNFFSVQLAQGPVAVAAGETVAVRATTTAGQAVSGSWADVVFGTVTYSTHGSGSYNSSTGVYTAQAAEKVRITALVTSAAVSLTTGQLLAAKIVKNGSDYATNQTNGTGASNVYGVVISDELDLVAGDTVKIQALCSVATNLNTAATRNNFSVSRVSR